MKSNVNKPDIIKRVKEKLKDERIHMPTNGFEKVYTQIVVETVIDALLEVMLDIIKDGDNISFDGYMSIKPKIRVEKVWNNPHNDNKREVIPACYKAKLYMGKKFKEACEQLSEREL